MQRDSQISFVVLTYNEELHIERCIRSLLPYAKEVWVIDSFSTDLTIALAERLGAKVVKHPFENQAQQFNWAIRNCDIRGEWIWRVDADEYISDELGERVAAVIRIKGGKWIYINVGTLNYWRKRQIILSTYLISMWYVYVQAYSSTGHPSLLKDIFLMNSLALPFSDFV